jgi:hypothetical protein
MNMSEYSKVGVLVDFPIASNGKPHPAAMYSLHKTSNFLTFIKHITFSAQDLCTIKNRIMKSNKKTARIVGILFLAGMVVGITGNILVQSTLGMPDYLSVISSNSMQLAIGAIFMLMTSVWDAAHGMLMIPILKQHHERMAYAYFGFRIFDAVFLAIQVLIILLQLPIGSEYLKAGLSEASTLSTISTILLHAHVYAYQMAMISLGLAGSILCFMFYRSELVPRFIAGLGLFGYATILLGSVLEVLGFNLNFIHTIPGGLWELFIGVWLIIKGFKASPNCSRR